MADQFDGYTGKKTAAQVSSFPKARISDFRVGLTYYYAESLGMVPLTTIIGGVQSDTGKKEWLIMKSVTVQEVTINRDLFDFQSWVNKGNAYLAVTASTTLAPTTTLVAPTTTAFNG